MEHGDSSDGEDVMAYFLPNGIADDSPPKRSTMMSSFGPIGGRVSTTSSATTTNRQPAFSGLGASTSAASLLSSPRGNFLLSDLGGDLHQPRSSDFGETHTPRAFGFASAFGSLDGEESAGRGSTGSFFERGSDRSGSRRVESPGSAFSGQSGFRADAEPFLPSGATNTGSSALGGGFYGRPPLTTPSYLASGGQDSSPFGSSGSNWPSSKPRRVLHAPPGLGSPSPDKSQMKLASGDGAILSGPPGLNGSHTSPFAAFSAPSTTSTTAFGDGNPFGPSLESPLSSLRISSDPFLGGADSVATGRSGISNPDLAELNAKSMTVEEVQSSLEATAIAAAQDAMAENPVRRTEGRRTSKSPKQSNDFGRGTPQDGSDEKKKNLSHADQLARTPTRRSTQSGGAASPARGNRGSDRRNQRQQSSPVSIASEIAAKSPDTTGKSGRKLRTTAENKPQTKTISHDALPPIPLALKKKSPSSVSSVDSDDQLVSAANATSAIDEGRQAKTRASPREGKSSGKRGTSATKPSVIARTTDKVIVSRRQIYREKQSVDASKDSQNESGSGNGSLVSGSDGEVNMGDAAAIPNEADQSVRKDEGRHTPNEASATPTEKKVVSSHVPPSIPHLPGGSSPQQPDQVESKSVDVSSHPNKDSSVNSTERDSNAKRAKQKVAVSTPVQAVKSPTNTSKPNVNQPASKPEVVSRRRRSSGSMSTSRQSSELVHSDDSKSPSSTDAEPEVKIEEASSSTSPQVSEPGDGNVTPPRSGSDKKTKESKKDKHKKDKAERKKTGAKSKKDKRETSSSGKGDLIDELEFVDPIPKNSPTVFASATTTITNGVYNGLRFARTGVSVAFSSLSIGWGKVSDQLNIKGVLFSGFSYLESFLAVVFSVILLLSLHGASWFIRIHRVAFRAILTHRHVGFCFAFLYAFPFLVQYVFPWAPPWAPVCLWYAFLVQLFCTNGPTAMVTTFRIILPLVFLVEGISHHSFLLDLNGAELLLASFILSALKTSNLCSPIFLLSLAAQCLSAVFLGSELVVQWLQMALALYSLHSMAATDEEWAGLRDEEEELSCQSMSMHHSIADYNYQPAPSAPSIQKTKRLDRRALAYVRGRKLR